MTRSLHDIDLMVHSKLKPIEADTTKDVTYLFCCAYFMSPFLVRAIGFVFNVGKSIQK